MSEYHRSLQIAPHEALWQTVEHREIFHDEMIALMPQIMRGDLSPLMPTGIISCDRAAIGSRRSQQGARQLQPRGKHG